VRAIYCRTANQIFFLFLARSRMIFDRSSAESPAQAALPPSRPIFESAFLLSLARALPPFEPRETAAGSLGLGIGVPSSRFCDHGPSLLKSTLIIKAYNLARVSFGIRWCKARIKYMKSHNDHHLLLRKPLPMERGVVGWG
jgi:hypothetical protein